MPCGTQKKKRKKKTVNLYFKIQMCNRLKWKLCATMDSSCVMVRCWQMEALHCDPVPQKMACPSSIVFPLLRNSSSSFNQRISALIRLPFIDFFVLFLPLPLRPLKFQARLQWRVVQDAESTLSRGNNFSVHTPPPSHGQPTNLHWFDQTYISRMRKFFCAHCFRFIDYALFFVFVFLFCDSVSFVECLHLTFASEIVLMRPRPSLKWPRPRWWNICISILTSVLMQYGRSFLCKFRREAVWMIFEVWFGNNFCFILF